MSQGQLFGPPFAYLDIETGYDEGLTVVGIHREDRGFWQAHGRRITGPAILEAMEGVTMLFTYNGHRFDLPRIREALDVDLRGRFPCRDLMHDCWRRKLMGGFKKVEERLGITRSTAGVDGLQAMALWAKYLDEDDGDALELLLRYNREDCENLQKVREALGILL